MTPKMDELVENRKLEKSGRNDLVIKVSLLELMHVPTHMQKQVAYPAEKNFTKHKLRGVIESLDTCKSTHFMRDVWPR